VQGGGDVDDGSRMTVSEPQIKHGFQHVERSQSVDFNDSTESVVAHAGDGAQKVTGRTVDDDVQSTKLLQRRFDRSLDLLGLAHISRHTQTSSSRILSCEQRILVRSKEINKQN
jgi:hypothetical protein